MARGSGQRSRAASVWLVILNVVGFLPLAIYMWLYVAHRHDSGVEIMALALAPFFVVTLTALITDLVVAIRSLRRPSSKARRSAAIAVIVVIGGFLAYNVVAIAVSAWQRHERNRPLSLSEARSLVAQCEVSAVRRYTDETHIVLRESADGSAQRHTDVENYEALARAVRRAALRCSHLAPVGTSPP
jgi:hypothetical protein